MRKIMITAVAAATLFAAGTLVGSMRLTSQSNADFDALFGMSAAAQAGGVYVNAVDLVIVPSEMSKFVEAIKENAAASVKEPGCREFNVTVLAKDPNHVFLYEVYDNEAALNTHRATDHFKKYAAATANMVTKRDVRGMSVIAFNSKGH
jgi:(4S)-4-hydroxy-5-phosphonooxypentane-2,3-dione isomerase